ncbi:MAG: phosphorylase, partial [Nitrospirota bacterium]
MNNKTEREWVPGTLWSRMTSAAGHALKTGALMPISTETSWITDYGIDFQ